MLAGNSQTIQLTDESDASALQVGLPEEIQRTFFTETGYAPTTAEEQRSRARLRVRSEAVVEVLEKAGQLVKDGTPTLALVKDLSRSGIAILYHEQLFPEDIFRVCFHGRIVTASVVRCRRMGSNCFEIGAGILATCAVEEESFDD